MRKRTNKQKSDSCVQISLITAIAEFSLASMFEKPSNVLTANMHDTWNARRFPPATITLEFTEIQLVTRIELLPDMLPERGDVEHRITLQDGTSCKTSVYAGDAENMKWISVNINPPTPAQKIDIITTKSPSFVAWRQIKVFATE